MLKNKTIFKSIAVALIMFMMVAALSPSVGMVDKKRFSAEIGYSVLASGSCNESITWEYNSYNMLIIKGNGDLPNYDSVQRAPWSEYSDNIETLIIDEGITDIGHEVVITTSFHDCEFLSTIYLPRSLKTIGTNVFSDSITEIYYFGSTSEWQNIQKSDTWTTSSDYTVHCRDGCFNPSGDSISCPYLAEGEISDYIPPYDSTDSGSGESGNDNPVQPPTQPSEGQTVEGSNGNKGYTNVEYTVDQTGWTFSVPAAQTFTKENLTLYGNVSISHEADKDIISLPSGQTITMTFEANNYYNGGFELRNGSNSVIPYSIGLVTKISSEGAALEVSNFTSNGCTVLTYEAGSPSNSNTGLSKTMAFSTTLDNIKNAKVTGLHTDTLTFTVNVTGGTSGGGSESGGSTTPTLISFTIDGTSYQAEEGMTWAQWVDSEYNTGTYHLLDGIIFNSHGYGIVINYHPISASELIVSNQEYTTSGGAGA